MAGIALMDNILIGYLFQHGECPLPGIGKFVITHSPATYDITDKLMNPPLERISFQQDTFDSTTGLIDVIAIKKGINKELAGSELEKYINNIKEVIEQDGFVTFNNLGTLIKNRDGQLEFNANEYSGFMKPIHGEKVREGNHPVLVGDSTVDSDTYHNRKIGFKSRKEQRWIIAAIIIFVLVISVALFHFYDHPFRLDTFGNQQRIQVVDPPVTHE